MIPVFVNFGRYNFAELFTHHMRKHLTLPADYVNFIHEIIVPLNELKFSRDEMINTGTLDFFIEHCVSKADTTTGGIDTTKNEREASLCKLPFIISIIGFLCTLWIMFPEKFDKVIETYDEPSSKNRIF